MDSSYLTKELLIYIAFTVDALNTICTFPLFVMNGPKWLLSTMQKQEQDMKKKDDDNDNNNNNDWSMDADRKSFQFMWDLFMVCYEGYFGFTISTFICIYKVPETIPIFAYSLFILYLYKLKFILSTKKNNNEYGYEQYKGKLYSVLFFFLPCYGGYCTLHLLEYFDKNN